MARTTLDPFTGTVGTQGLYYSGKEKADRRYAQERNAPFSPLTAAGRNAKAGKPATPYSISNPKPGSYADVTQQAALAGVESELQDEQAAQNALQAERTFQLALNEANRPRTPGGSFRRGTTSIGAATGAGLAKANMEARAGAKRKAAQLAAQKSIMDRAIGG